MTQTNNSKKINMKPFNLEEALAGKKVVTRLGFPVKIITISFRNELIAVVDRGLISPQEAQKWKLDGSKYSPRSEHFLDLFMAE